MNQELNISVIMPAYNSEKTIKDAIESVRAQTYDKWELIIIDDASSDHTVSIVNSFSNDERIRLLQNTNNSGVASSRNRGIGAAKYEWIAFLDSDDIWTSTKLEEQVELICKKDAELIYTGSGYMNEEGEMQHYTLHVPPFVDFRSLLKQNVMSCSSVMVKKDLMLTFPMPDAPMIHEDFATWVAMLRKIPYAYGIDKPLLVYRLSNSSKSGNKLKAAIMTWNTYRYLKLPLGQSLYYMAAYTRRNIRKYAKIYRSKQ